MLRCVAALLFVAMSQGLSMQKADPVDLKPAGMDKARNFKEVAWSPTVRDLMALCQDSSGPQMACQEGITYPAVSDLMVLSEELLKPAELRKGKVDDEKDDDAAKKLANTEMATKELKKGDGKTFVAKGNKVKLLMKGKLVQAHFQDVQFEGIYEYEYPMAKFPGIAGQANPLGLIKDTKLLPEMSAGAISEVTLKDKKTKEMNTFEVQLLEVKKESAAKTDSKASKSAELKDLSREATFVKILEKQKAAGMTMHRKVLKVGDGKTVAKKGDIVTMRQTGTLKDKDKTLFMNTTTTYPYPMLMEPFTMKVKGTSFKVKFSWDEKMVPDMTEGEQQEISFDPVQFKMGTFVGPKFKVPTFNMELLKVQHAKK